MQEHAMQTARLQALVNSAVSLAASPPESDPHDLEEALDALRQLEIVEVVGIHHCGNFYALCDDDRNEGRAGVIEALAKRGG
jgi:hypothetical protein